MAESKRCGRFPSQGAAIEHQLENAPPDEGGVTGGDPRAPEALRGHDEADQAPHQVLPQPGERHLHAAPGR